MELELSGCSNSGFSLTWIRKKQIIELADWVKDNINDDYKTYKEFQDEIEKESINLDGSKVRMIVPFLKKMGYFNLNSFQHKNEKSRNNDLFTSEGKCFIEYLKVCEEILQLKDEQLLKEIKEIDELFNIIGIINLSNNDEKIYLECIKFLKKYNSMDKNEFFIITTLIDEYQYDVYEKNLEIVISNYRNGIYEKLNIVKNINAFNYITAILQESGLIMPGKEKLKLNNKYIDIINMLITI